MMLMPPPKDSCPICGVKHSPELPHNQESLYYKYRFYGVRGRWPTWADAIAHCSPEMQLLWYEELQEAGQWTEPEDGRPIADPPAESFNQPVGDLNTCGFGPEVEEE